MHTLRETSPLSEPQRAFCAGILEGLSPTQSYLKIYKCKASAAPASASRLLKTAKVSEHLDRLKGISESRSILTRLEKLERLSEMALRTGIYSDASCADSRAAISEANRMEGDLAAAKTEAIVANFSLSDLLAPPDDEDPVDDGWAAAIDESAD